MRPYRTLFMADLVQDSALSSGGTEPDEPMVDDHFCRDGMGRLTLRGDGLAGAMVATARKLVGRIPEDISGGHGTSSLKPSRWTVLSSHPVDGTETEFRRCVGIRQDTGARAEGVLYDLEATPRGTVWPLLVDVDSFGDGGTEAESLAAATLLEWERGRCWLGRDVARGLGWMRLRNLRALRMDISQALLWPDSNELPLEQAKRLPGSWVQAEAFGETFGEIVLSDRWRYVEVVGEIIVGARADGYGIDGFAVGGHALPTTTSPFVAACLRPEGVTEDAFTASFDPDTEVSLTRLPTGEVEPLIPGSGLRGPQRHSYSRHLRQANPNQDIRDPNVRTNVSSGNPDPIEDFFGTMEQSAALLVRDAHIVDRTELSTAVLQHHAEDEFIGGVFDASKFDRSIVMAGRFAWKMVLETTSEELEALFVEKWLPYLTKIGASRALPIGAGKWRSAGWPEWRVGTVCRGFAGRKVVPLSTETAR